jgi:hypothetical protein
MTRCVHAVVVVVSLLVAMPAAAQTNPGELSFTVPLNITNLMADITRVRVACSVTSQAITVGRFVVKNVLQPGSVANSVELPVSGGQVLTTVTVTVSVAGVLEDPAGKVAAYSCGLVGYSNALREWRPFNHCSSSATGNLCTEVQLRLTPSQFPNNSGTFTW